ncbi:MAG TPA: accessory factor UbiK family protein [Burkholderiales bacterium]|nr:accessory factor UbiK family protein [Burkholderiales bacterium]
MDRRFIDEISRRAAEVIASTPVGDMQKNLRALFTAWLERLDLVTREELDAQMQVLRRTREKLEQLEARVAQLEARGKAEGMKRETRDAQ